MYMKSSLYPHILEVKRNISFVITETVERDIILLFAVGERGQSVPPGNSYHRPFGYLDKMKTATNDGNQIGPNTQLIHVVKIATIQNKPER